MVSDHKSRLPEAALPPGYRFAPLLGAEGVDAWVNIWREAHPGLNVDDRRFRNAFGHDEALIAERLALLLSPDGRAVGTGAAWFGEAFPGAGPIGRLHWLAVRPSAQGRGLGSALLAFLAGRLRDTHTRSYLVTQSDREAAIHLYQRFGYVIAESPP
jgi:ribosomal protein S18 acetylase RimI-like enzyme